MVIKKQKTYAFIDSQNLNLGVRDAGWKLDWVKFRKYLTDKFGVSNAYLFVGYVPGNNKLYASLQEAGYITIFKETLQYKDGTIKGNVDAELVLHTMIQYPNYKKAVIVTGDGDFYCLVDHLRSEEKLKALMIPNEKRYSALLKKINTSDEKYIYFVSQLKRKLEYPVKKKRAR